MSYNICIHEAAHAVVAQYFNLPVYQVVVEGDSGYCQYGNTKSEFIQAVIAYAGYYAEVSAGVDVPSFRAIRFMSDRATVDNTDYSYEELEDALDIIFDAHWNDILAWANRI